jgi:hypothetical protein
MSLPTPFQTKHAVTMHLVACMPEWAKLWMAWKTVALSASGTRSLVMPYSTSHSRLSTSSWKALTEREEDLLACSMLGPLVPDGRIQGRWTQKWPSKISCGLGSQRPRKRPNSKFPNFNNNWQKFAQKFLTKDFYCTFSDDLGGGRLAA